MYHLVCILAPVLLMLCRSTTLLVLGALLGTQNGRDVEIVNTFELAVEDDGVTIDQGFLVARKEQCQCLIYSIL